MMSKSFAITLLVSLFLSAIKTELQADWKGRITKVACPVSPP
jgi:hypothetical protein